MLKNYLLESKKNEQINEGLFDSIKNFLAKNLINMAINNFKKKSLEDIVYEYKWNPDKYGDWMKMYQEFEEEVYDMEGSDMYKKCMAFFLGTMDAFDVKVRKIQHSSQLIKALTELFSKHLSSNEIKDISEDIFNRYVKFGLSKGY